MADEAHDAIETGEDHHLEQEEKVTPLELFFDLVFVFALTQVTSLMSANPTWEGLAQGMLVLAVVWWAWADATGLEGPRVTNECRGNIGLSQWKSVAGEHAANVSDAEGLACRHSGLLCVCP